MTSSDRLFFPIVGGEKIKIKIGLFPAVRRKKVCVTYMSEEKKKKRREGKEEKKGRPKKVLAFSLIQDFFNRVQSLVNVVHGYK